MVADKVRLARRLAWMPGFHHALVAFPRAFAARARSRDTEALLKV